MGTISSSTCAASLAVPGAAVCPRIEIRRVKPKVLGIAIDISGIARAIPELRSASTSVSTD
jgi:hypothetical protein